MFGIKSFSAGQLRNSKLNLSHFFKKFISLATGLPHNFEEKEKRRRKMTYKQLTGIFFFYLQVYNHFDYYL
jgi:hypothetical protein